MLLPFVLIVFAAGTAAQQRATIKSDWKFPAPKVKEKYDSERKATMYDLGDGFFAERVKLDGKDLVIVSIPLDADKDLRRSSESEMAFIVADTTLNLSMDFDKLFLKPDGHEYRFLTMNGASAGVTIAHDRKTAVVRLLPVEVQ